MKVKFIQDEDFVNYKEISMFIGFCKCDFKCDKECGYPVCQNSLVATMPSIEISTDEIVKRYLNNPLTKAIVFGGLEPIDQLEELVALISKFREKTEDDIVIYTGYTEDELKNILDRFTCFKNIIIKYGRFRPYNKRHLDPVLGIELASDNQYAKKIS